MAEPVTLLVPVEESYRALVPDVAKKYVDIAGGSPADGQALADHLSAALQAMTESMPPEAAATLSFRIDGSGIEVLVQCESHATVVKQPLPARHVS